MNYYLLEIDGTMGEMDSYTLSIWVVIESIVCCWYWIGQEQLAINLIEWITFSLHVADAYSFGSRVMFKDKCPFCMKRWSVRAQKNMINILLQATRHTSEMSISCCFQFIKTIPEYDLMAVINVFQSLVCCVNILNRTFCRALMDKWTESMRIVTYDWWSLLMSWCKISHSVVTLKIQIKSISHKVFDLIIAPKCEVIISWRNSFKLVALLEYGLKSSSLFRWIWFDSSEYTCFELNFNLIY